MHLGQGNNSDHGYRGVVASQDLGRLVTGDAIGESTYSNK